jgi:hypothetical protein
MCDETSGDKSYTLVENNIDIGILVTNTMFLVAPNSTIQNHFLKNGNFK